MRGFAGVALVLLGCGGIQDTSGSDAGPTKDAFDEDPYAGYTACSGPNGLALCGGSCGFATCPPSKCYSNFGLAPKHDLAVCDQYSGPALDASAFTRGCRLREDGEICVYLQDVESQPDPLTSFNRIEGALEGVGFMYHLGGRDDLVRYADRAAYHGVPLPPPPTSCPDTPGLKLCGGACGGCPTNEYTCMGRSPMHPYSLCAFTGPAWSLSSPQVWDCVRGDSSGCFDGSVKKSCFVWKVDPVSQPIADQHGICIDTDQCAAAQKLYPGGGFCAP